MPSPLSLLAAIAYLAAAWLLSRRVRGADGVPRGVPLVIGALAVAAHAAGHVTAFSRLGPDLHFVPSLSIAALLVAALAIAISAWRPVEAIGIVAFPIAAASSVAFGSHQHVAAAAIPEWQIALHVVLALLAVATLTIAALIAIMLDLQERALRQRRIAEVMRAFPPLSLVEALLFHLIAAGFALLSATVLTGVLFIHDWFAQHLVHKTVLTLAAWLIFGVLLFGHRRWGWRGIRAARFTLAGITLLLLGFLGSKFVLEVLLQRTG
ncbi:MAG TPA: cytochrome c biogenesis protein CcsA [Candidatus Saccharimonadia bacterium]|nr:cytochrome c biogenesis protein CcsA [Candidatus Saccharimonadia bacterium]